MKVDTERCGGDRINGENIGTAEGGRGHSFSKTSSSKILLARSPRTCTHSSKRENG